MTYQDITHYNATSYTAATRSAVDIDGIVIHHWGVDGQDFDAVCRFFESGPGTSAHYVAEDGRVACIVSPKDIAWHAGNWPVNQRTIGIECRPEMTDGDIETVAELIADLETHYGKSFLISGHKDHFNTSCPGRYYDNIQRIVDRVNAIKDGVPAAPAPLPKEEVKRLKESYENLMRELQEAVAAGEEIKQYV